MLFPHLQVDSSTGLLYIVHKDQRLTVWNLDNLQKTLDLELFTGGKRQYQTTDQVGFSPDSQKLLVNNKSNGKSLIWDLPSGECTTVRQDKPVDMQAACFLESRQVFIKDKGDSYYLYDVKKEQRITYTSQEIVHSFEELNPSLRFSFDIQQARQIPGSAQLLFVSDLSDMFVFDYPTREASIIAEGDEFLYDYDISADGKYLVHSFMEIYALAGTGMAKKIDAKKTGIDYASRIRYLPDGKSLAALTQESELLIISIDTGEVKKRHPQTYQPHAVEVWQEQGVFILLDERDIPVLVKIDS